jgi:hypothetical protein
MAKKVVAGLKKATSIVKILKPVKHPKTGKYRFKIEIVDKTEVQEHLKD